MKLIPLQEAPERVVVTYGLIALILGLGCIIFLSALLLAAFFLDPFKRGIWIAPFLSVGLFGIGSVLLGLIEMELKECPV